MTSFVWWVPAEDGSEEREFVRQYLNRELGLVLLYGGDQPTRQLERYSKGLPILVATDSTDSKLFLLRQFPRKSVILFLIGDEKYDLKVNLRAIFSRRISHLVREYPLPSFGSFFRIPIVLVANLLAVLRFPRLLPDAFIALFKGMKMSFSQTLILSLTKLCDVKHIDLPLGYTNEFAENVSGFFNLSRSESLVKSAASLIDTQKRLDVTFFFSGQTGQFDRKLMRKVFESKKIAIGPFYPGYMGKNSKLSDVVSNYCEGLRNAKYALCPAGNWSRESFRFFESLILGATPISSRYVLSDPLSKPIIRDSFGTWPQLSQVKLDAKSEQLLESRRKELLEKWQGQISFVKGLTNSN